MWNRTLYEGENSLKFLVTGPYDAGKSTFIKTLTEGSSVSIDKHGTTVAMDHGTIKVENLLISIFGTPGMKRFHLMRKILSKGADGVILVIDSVNREKDTEVMEIWNEINKNLPGVPVIVVANKQDMPQARPIPELRKNLPALAQLPMIPVSAAKGTNVLPAIRVLVAMFITKWKELFRVLSNYDDKPNNFADAIKALNLDFHQLSEYIRWLNNRGLIDVHSDRKTYTMNTAITPLIENLQKVFEGDTAIVDQPHDE
ncbi:MAG: GTP-binding protein [Candidatus Ranarchaeia archaeon]